MRGLPRAASKLLVVHTDYAPKIVAVPPPRPSSNQSRVRELVVRMLPGVRVHGQVLDAAGRPVAGARLFAPYPKTDVLRTMTGREGRYVIARMNHGSRLRMIADPGVAESWTEERVIPRNRATQSVQIDFHASETIEGTVRRGGLPVPWAVITAVPAGGVVGVISAQADENGAFQLLGMREGIWTVQVWSESCQARFRYENTGDGTGTLDLDLPPGELSGRVIDEVSEDPLFDVEVSWSGALRSSAGYRFEIPGPNGMLLKVEDNP